MVRIALALAFALLAVPATAGDVPVAGAKLRLHAGREARIATAILADAAIAPPFADPTAGARLIVSGGAAAGHCFAEIPLDPAGWSPLRGDGSGRGWRYRKAAPGTSGIRSILVRDGRISVRARGTDWPCDLSASAQRLPVRVELRLDATRYCAAFGGDLRVNQSGRFAAVDAAAPAACPDTDVTIANLNILHGLFCAGACRASDRIDLFYQWLAAEGCPDIVTLQEISGTVEPLLTAQLGTVCPFVYEQVYISVFGIDDAMVLSRHAVAEAAVTRLYKNFRHVVHARIDHPLGPLDVFTTHLASSSDGAGNPCGGDCPTECVTAGAATVRQCQAVQTALLVEATHDAGTPALLAGDFNAAPGDPEYLEMTSRGWLDSHLEAGNPECEPLTGAGCTSGRASDDLSELESPAANVDERIDFIFLVPPAVASCAFDSPADSDGDGVATKIFGEDPNPFAPSCGPSPDPICWPSDHEGNIADLNCG